VKERKIVLSALVKYWCIYHYHKCCKAEDIELGAMQVILISMVVKTGISPKSFGYRKIVNCRIVTKIVRFHQKQNYIIIKKNN